MRYLFVFAGLVFLGSCQQAHDGSIGQEFSADKFSINRKVEDSLISDWNKMLKRDSINTTIYELKILKEKEPETNKYYYGILGTTNGDSAKVMTEIQLREGKFYFPKSEVTNTVICYGSPNCYPRMSQGKWFCDDGSNKPSCSANCQKSIVATVKQ